MNRAQQLAEAAAEAIANHGLRFAPEATRDLAEVTPPAPTPDRSALMWPLVAEEAPRWDMLGEIRAAAEQQGMWVTGYPIDFTQDTVRVRLVTGETLHEGPCRVVPYDGDEAAAIEWTTATGSIAPALRTPGDVLGDIDDLLEEWESGEDVYRWKP